MTPSSDLLVANVWAVSATTRPVRLTTEAANSSRRWAAPMASLPRSTMRVDPAGTTRPCQSGGAFTSPSPTAVVMSTEASSGNGLNR
jgi:hypothetical protein